jgi:pilus assembly protein CpaF
MSFGRRVEETPRVHAAAAVPAVVAAPIRQKPTVVPFDSSNVERTEVYYANLRDIREGMNNGLDISAIANMNAESKQIELRKAFDEVVEMKAMALSTGERNAMLTDMYNDMFGFGPLESLLERDDIADIMVNGTRETFIEVQGRIEPVAMNWESEEQLMNICARMAQRVGRRVDASSPICDARLQDGSRINVIVPPLAIDGPTLTIRKFKRDHLRIDDLVRFGAIDERGAEVLGIIGRVRCNVLVSGGTGSGKTTLLNVMASFIDREERVITCEDTAELQLQQPHVVRLETKPANIENQGRITMTDLVKNCLRMRPDRIIVGEVRGEEAFDLLQAMNTGHDGSMGTLHANSPREALSRLESMIMQGQTALPSKVIRETIRSAVNVVIQTKRLRDGSRRITHITEIAGMEGDVITLQDIYIYDMTGEDSKGKIIGHHRPGGTQRPAFHDRAKYYRLDERLGQALQEV